MNQHITGMVIDTADEVRLAKARIADLEEAVLSLRKQIVLLREAVYDVAEGAAPRLAEVGR